MIICASLSLLHSFTTVSFENSFILSRCLTIPAVSLSVLSKTQHQKAFSLNAGALSLWHTHYFNGDMGWCGCGCDEILIQRCITVLLLVLFRHLSWGWVWILSVSLRLLSNRWQLLLIAGLKLKSSLTKWQSPLQTPKDKSFFLRKLTGFVPQF